jgi:hypothetical protein
LQGERGEKGEPGAPGKDGRDAEPVEIESVVKELLSAPELRTLIDLHVAEGIQRHFEEHPVRDGKDGERGPQGEKGLDGERGPQGEKGLDGVGMAGALIDREGTLVITTTKGEAIKLGAVIGKDGAPGRDGKDGADFTDAEIDYDGERTIVIRGKGGELKKRLPIPMDKGYWREGMACEKGDIVTHGGNAFIALRDNAAKPCVENSDDWRIFARKGRDGATGPAGKDYVPPSPVKLGSRNA